MTATTMQRFEKRVRDAENPSVAFFLLLSHKYVDTYRHFDQIFNWTFNNEQLYLLKVISMFAIQY